MDGMELHGRVVEELGWELYLGIVLLTLTEQQDVISQQVVALPLGNVEMVHYIKKIGFSFNIFRVLE